MQDVNISKKNSVGDQQNRATVPLVHSHGPYVLEADGPIVIGRRRYDVQWLSSGRCGYGSHLEVSID